MEDRRSLGPRQDDGGAAQLPPPGEAAVARLPAPARHGPLRWLRRASAGERDEILSAWSHAVPAGVAALALGPLLAAADSAGQAALAGFYGVALVVLFAVSAALHFARKPRLRNRLGLLDRLAIYLAIAATYTAVAGLGLPAPWGPSLVGAVWGVAVAGAAANIALYPKRRAFQLFQLVNLVAYLVMGWSGLIFAGAALWHAFAPAALAWLLGGGAFYSAGVAFFVGERIPYNHTIWHGFVIAGAACHYVVVLAYVLPGA